MSSITGLWSASYTFLPGHSRPSRRRSHHGTPGTKGRGNETGLSERLRRRLSATTPIGCAYRVTRLDMAEGFDSDAWLPGDLMDGEILPGVTNSGGEG